MSMSVVYEQYKTTCDGIYCDCGFFCHILVDAIRNNQSYLMTEFSVTLRKRKGFLIV